MEKIEHIKICNLSGGGKCKLLNYGSMNDVIRPLSYDFVSGQVYGVIGEFGTGGWALSCILTGKYKWDEGKIVVNGKDVCNNEMFKFGCYVGEDVDKRNFFWNSGKTVGKQIKYGIKRGLSFNNSFNYIQSKFDLSCQRINRPIKYVSGERWKASMAIGYAMGKGIYCFPWLNTRYIQHLKEHLKICIEPLLKIGAIIIIPTSKEKTLLDIMPQTKFIFLDNN